MTRLALLTLLPAVLLSGASSADVALPEESRVPGGIALINLGESQAVPGEVVYNDHRAPVLRTTEGWVAVIGIPLDTPPGKQVATLTPASGPGNRGGGTAAPAARALEFDVADKKYAEQRLKVENKRHVNPNAQDLERIDLEQVRIDAALGAYTPGRIPILRMQPPVGGERSSSFGLRRYFNGEARKPHSGMDIAAPAGTKIGEISKIQTAYGCK